jgi:hypothetical protein
VALRIGVRLAVLAEDLSEWLADAAAFDAAGADALWVDLPPDGQPGAELDPLALIAALTAVTFRSLLVTSGAAAARTIATVEQLSRGRLRLVDETGPGVFEPEPAERWLSVETPDGRESWRAMLADVAERGYQGVVVTANPRLLDILRNPGDPGERMDLQLAMG